VSIHVGDNTQTSRTRLLNAGKTLFARNGYEQTSTAAIARESGSSESQLIRYFGGKAGLLEAIFNDAWSELNEVVHDQVSDSAHARDAIIRVISALVEAFGRDHDIAFLFLFEGRRVRSGTQAIGLSNGYSAFLDAIDALTERGIEDGSFRRDLDPQLLRSGILGCAEGMLRDRVMAKRNGQPNHFDDEALLRTFTAMVNGLG
jgi:TetR/AcrR family transcriptional regulator, fatty acid metabolism regulator protein